MSILPRQVPPLKLKPQPIVKKASKHGRWHMAENGHAVYCYGPVVNAASTGNQPKRYATQCRGTNNPVPLHD